MAGSGCEDPEDGLHCRMARVVKQGTALGMAHSYHSTFLSPPSHKLGTMASGHGQE